MINIEKDEKIILEIRRHNFIILIKIISLIFMAVLPLAITDFWKLLDINLLINGKSPIALFIFVYALWILVLWISGFIFWTDNYLDVWILTDKRIILINQRGLFSREVSYINLDKIQDITTEINGILNTFIKMGDIHIQTAGENKEFIMPNVKDPDKNRNIISNAVEGFKKNQKY